jgi:3',5'-cyclic-AMP phosphodiesterase
MVKKIVVLTDLHIMAEARTILGIGPTPRLAAAIDHIHKTSADADLVVITGDLTNFGDAPSYALLRQLLAKLRIPIRLLIGNHDIRENFQAEFPEAVRDQHGFVQFAENLGDWCLIGLDSANQPQLGGTRQEAGWLCDKRLQFLDRALDEAAQQRVIVFLHHPPFTSGFPAMDAIKLMNADALLDRLAGHGNVQVVVTGHIHRTMSATIRGIPQAMFKSTAHQMPLDFVSDDSSIACVEPPAYGILLLTDEGVVVHTEDYLWPSVMGPV